MASTNQTTNYGLPLYQTGDQALWTDTNTPFEEIDTALKTAADNASGAASSVSTLQTTVTTLAQTVSGHTTQLSTLETSVATASTAQGTSFTAHGLNTATNVQTAIQNAATAAINSYDNTNSGLNSENVQSAIDEISTKSPTILGGAFSGTVGNVLTNNVLPLIADYNIVDTPLEWARLKLLVGGAVYSLGEIASTYEYNFINTSGYSTDSIGVRIMSIARDGSSRGQIRVISSSAVTVTDETSVSVSNVYVILV